MPQQPQDTIINLNDYNPRYIMVAGVASVMISITLNYLNLISTLPQWRMNIIKATIPGFVGLMLINHAWGRMNQAAAAVQVSDTSPLARPQATTGDGAQEEQDAAHPKSQ